MSDYILFLLLLSILSKTPKWLPTVIWLFAELARIRTFGLRHTLGWWRAGFEFWLEDSRHRNM